MKDKTKPFLRVLLAMIVLLASGASVGAQLPPEDPEARDRGADPGPVRRPDALLWDQPRSTSNANVYASQDYELRLDTYDIVLADDFANTSPWQVNAIYMRGDTYSSGCDLTCADRFTWEIYGDAGGAPDGDPWGGGNAPVWSISLASSDPQLSLAPSPSGWLANVSLDLNYPVVLAPGTWWLAFYPSLNTGACGCQYGRHVSTSSNGYAAQVINPGGAFGFPPGWNSVQDPATWDLAEQDLAFRLEGTILTSLGDRVWYDTDQDGIQDAGEQGVEGIRVDLYNDTTCSGGPMQSDTTDSSGLYGFLGLLPGTYCLQFSDIPSGWQISPQQQGEDGSADSDADPATGKITSIQPSADDMDQDMGLYLNGSVGDTVWCDENLNGSLDPGEGVMQVPVNLYADHGCDAEADGLLESQETATNGYYLFDGLLVGPSGSPVCYVAKVDSTVMGDCSLPITPTTHGVALDTDDPDKEDADFGFTLVFELGDRAWYDTDADGIQDAGEPGVDGIAVDLYDSADCSGDSVASTTSDSAGIYGFGGLGTGTYCLQFHDIPPGWFISPPNEGSDDTADSDADPGTGRVEDILLVDDDPDQDVGLYAEGSAGDTVWCDLDQNGEFDVGEGVVGVTVNLYEDDDCDAVPGVKQASQDTVGDGAYLFEDLRVGPAGIPLCYVARVELADMGYCSDPITPIQYDIRLDVEAPDSLDNDFGFTWILDLGDKVWYDTDQDGVQDPQEPGVEGIGVGLYDSEDCSGVSLASDVTDASGIYDFSHLPPDTYCLQFDDIPAGWLISPQHQGEDGAVDSDADPDSGQIQEIALTADDLDQDMGLYVAGTVGGAVWCDENRNGELDAGEGMAGVEVALGLDDDCDNEADGPQVSEDTGAHGDYDFDGLFVGPSGSPICYVVEVTGDVGNCHLPLTPGAFPVALDVDAPDSQDNDFGFKPPWLVYLPYAVHDSK